MGRLWDGSPPYAYLKNRSEAGNGYKEEYMEVILELVLQGPAGDEQWWY